jgi:hypothetical protein
MLKRILLILGIFILAGVLTGAGIMILQNQVEEGCPEGYVSVVTLEPIQPGESNSKLIGHKCRPADNPVEPVELQPMSPEEFEAARPPDEWADQGEAVNGIINGPSDEDAYRCVVMLEPIQPGEQFSKASESVCAKGPIDTVDGVSLESSFLIAKFYNRTGYTYLLQEYYGAQACSPYISYGVGALPDNLDNKFASGRAFSNCDHIDVYDFNNYTGASYSCGANCSSFYALNDEVISSWRASD